mgnify:FL=1
MKNKQTNSRQAATNSCLLLVVFCILSVLFTSCDEKQYQPKPRAYFRIDFPEKEYVRIDTMRYFSFEYPVYSTITPDYLSPNEKEWINIEYPAYKGTLHLSYKTVEDNLGKYLEDSYYMMTKHVTRAPVELPVEPLLAIC